MQCCFVVRTSSTTVQELQHVTNKFFFMFVRKPTAEHNVPETMSNYTNPHSYDVLRLFSTALKIFILICPTVKKRQKIEQIEGDGLNYI